MNKIMQICKKKEGNRDVNNDNHADISEKMVSIVTGLEPAILRSEV